MNSIMRRLSQDHVNLARLLDFIGSQADLAATDGSADLDALIAAIDYLREYTGAHHHPLEDAVCAQLKRIRPGLSSSVNSLLREHMEIDARLTQFNNLIVNVRECKGVSRADFASAAKTFVNAERAHMAREETQLFPAAQSVLRAKDWELLEERVSPAPDPLFGFPPSARYEALRKQLS